ncbi:MAG: alpha-ribazole phosphatase [Clostridiales bacterium]|jgi:alpha-ribazole phosphatase|nr:alpha-ribazole phosphatase [Clostridiales bacterium]
MIVYLIRHGQTSANVERKFAGSWDVPLNERGISQAMTAREKLKDIPITAVYASPLQRAAITAKTISEPHGLPVVTDSNLKEMNFGIWEKRFFSDVQKESPELLNRWFQNYREFRVEGGESVDELYDRVSKAYDGILSKYDVDGDDAIVIVAHGGVIQTLMSHICYGDTSGYWRFEIENCGVNKIEYVMGYPVIKSINK